MNSTVVNSNGNRIGGEVEEYTLPKGWGIKPETLELWQLRDTWDPEFCTRKINTERTLTLGLDTDELRYTVVDQHETQFRDAYQFNIGMHNLFYNLAHKHMLYSLVFSTPVYFALKRLEEDNPEVLPRIALELAPSFSNDKLFQNHGTYYCYRKGCHGPLCRAANSRTVGKARATPGSPYLMTDPVKDLYELSLSYAVYQSYINTLTVHRQNMLASKHDTYAAARRRVKDPTLRRRLDHMENVLSQSGTIPNKVTLLVEVTPENVAV